MHFGYDGDARQIYIYDEELSVKIGKFFKLPVAFATIPHIAKLRILVTDPAGLPLLGSERAKLLYIDTLTSG